jgi:hypothetical protein
MTGEVQEQDKDSGLANWECVCRTKRRGGLTGRTLEGEQVEATFLDRDGHMQHAAGTVRRSDASELVVVESLSGRGRKETAVTRDANVTVRSR